MKNLLVFFESVETKLNISCQFSRNTIVSNGKFNLVLLEDSRIDIVFDEVGVRKKGKMGTRIVGVTFSERIAEAADNVALVLLLMMSHSFFFFRQNSKNNTLLIENKKINFRK